MTASDRAEMAVRAATAADMEAVAVIYGHYVSTTSASFEEEPPGEEEMRRRFEASTSHGLPYLVAEGSGVIKGYCFAGIYKDRAAYRYTVEDSIFVDPNAAGQGIGSLLLSELILRCRALGKRQMMAVIADSQNTGSIRLHEKLGFDHIGIGRDLGFKHGRWLDIVYMQRDLTRA